MIHASNQSARTAFGHPELATQSSRAHLLYNRARRQGQWGQVWSRLTGSPQALLSLKGLTTSRVPGTPDGKGVRAVSIRDIHGSVGRASDFDRNFRPTQDRTRNRWLGIAAARETGIALPPVSLAQIGASYFVRDGHHRISVAQALGEHTIDARVVEWQLEG